MSEHHRPEHNQRWRDEALCRQTDPEIFFPEKGRACTDAKRVCAVCPVRAECLTDALQRRDTAYGVLGGTTPTERRELLRTQAAIARRERGWVA